MTSASFFPRQEVKALLSKGYRNGEESEDLLLCNQPSPESSLYASVIDLSRFIRMIFADGMAEQTRFLRPDTLREMLTPQNSNIPLDLDFRIGLGWFLNDVDIKNAGLVASHGGSLSLFHSQLIILPGHKLGVAVLANSSTALSVVNHVAEEALKSALEAKTGIRQPKEEKSASEPISPWSRMALKKYEGHYATGIRVYTVRRKGERLYTSLMGKPVQLVSKGNGLFSVRYYLFGFIPIKLGQLEDFEFSLDHIAGREVLVLHHQGRKHVLGEKIEPGPIPEVWLRRVGEYQIINPENYFPVLERASLQYEDHLLILDVKVSPIGGLGVNRLSFAIRPVSDTEAIICGLGRNLSETIHVVNRNGEERFLYSGCEFIKKQSK